MASQTVARPELTKRRGALGVGVAFLVVVLLVGVGIGYYVAPRSQAPPGGADILVLSDATVHPSVLAGPMPDMFSFVVGGLKNPTVQVKPGTQVLVHFLNIDTDLPHSLVFVVQAPPYAAGFTAQPAFTGAESANPIAGVPPGGNATFSFAAGQAGTYWYVCGVSAHASSGMYGKFVVQA